MDYETFKALKNANIFIKNYLGYCNFFLMLCCNVMFSHINYRTLSALKLIFTVVAILYVVITYLTDLDTYFILASGEVTNFE